MMMIWMTKEMMMMSFRTNSFIENYRKTLVKEQISNNEVDIKNILEEPESKIKKLIKAGTITDKLLISSIKQAMKERVNNG